jgi:hypothetical protein
MPQSFFFSFPLMGTRAIRTLVCRTWRSAESAALFFVFPSILPDGSNATAQATRRASLFYPRTLATSGIKRSIRNTLRVSFSARFRNIRKSIQAMTTDKTQESGNPAPFQVLKALAEISIVISAGLFLVGWSYLYRYYRGFGLAASELNLPLQAILIYSLPVIESVIKSIAFWSGVVGLFVVVLLLKPLLRVSVIVLALLLASPLISWYAAKVGRASANRDAFLSTSTLPFVKLDGTADTEVSGCSLDESNYHLLLRAKGQIYVILPIDSTSGPISANLRVCAFPESRIQSTRIQVGIEEKR